MKNILPVLFVAAIAWSLPVHSVAQDVVFRAESKLVQIPFWVTSNGRPVPGLKKDAFTFFEEGKEIEAPFFTEGTEPFNLLIIIDQSGSMEGAGEQISKAATLEFIHSLRENDRASVLVFAEEAVPLVDFTSDRRKLEDLVNFPPHSASGGSAIWTSAYNGIEKLFRGHEGQQNAAVLISDGDNNAGDRTIQDLRRLTLSKNISFHMIHVGTKKTVRELKDLADASHGTYFPANSPKDLEAGFARILSSIKNAYSVGFYPPDPQSKRWRSFEVRSRDATLKVSARPGYCLSVFCVAPSAAYSLVPKDYKTALAVHADYVVPTGLRGKKVRMKSAVETQPDDELYFLPKGRLDPSKENVQWAQADDGDDLLWHLLVEPGKSVQKGIKLDRGTPLEIQDISARVLGLRSRPEYWATEIRFGLADSSGAQVLSAGCRFPATILTDLSPETCLRLYGFLFDTTSAPVKGQR